MVTNETLLESVALSFYHWTKTITKMFVHLNKAEMKYKYNPMKYLN